MAVKNLNEDIVVAEYDRLLPTVSGFCGCRACQDDVMVFALNRLPPHYVTQRRSAVVSHVQMQHDQNVADVSVALMRGFKIVGESPRAGHDQETDKTE